MNDYKPLTKRLIELNAAVFCCPEAGHGCEHAKERATAKYHLAAPAHEYAAVVLALIEWLERYLEPSELELAPALEHVDWCSGYQSEFADPCDCGMAALDALQAALL